MPLLTPHCVSEEEEVAEIFNEFFVTKIKDLKSGIDPVLMEDPIVRLKEKMKNNKQNFSFKTVTREEVIKTINSLKQKKSHLQHVLPKPCSPYFHVSPIHNCNLLSHL